MKTILITEFMDEIAVDALRRSFQVAYSPRIFGDRPALLEAVPAADALIVRNRTRVDAELLGRAAALRVVGRLGVGLDNIDVPACAAKGIRVIPATGANALAVAEYVICAAMLMLRGAFFSSQAVLDGAWPREAVSNGRELSGKTLGLVGFGEIGQLVARAAKPFDVKVLGFDPALPAEHPVWPASGARCCGLDALLRESDVVSIHVPLTPQTRHLLDAGRIGLMKSDAVLINTARGGVIDEAALAEALRQGRLGGAALDVFEAEPLLRGSALSGVPNLLLTPHIAGLTRESNRRVSEMIARKVAEALA